MHHLSTGTTSPRPRWTRSIPAVVIASLVACGTTNLPPTTASATLVPSPPTATYADDGANPVHYTLPTVWAWLGLSPLDPLYFSDGPAELHGVRTLVDVPRTTPATRCSVATFLVTGDTQIIDTESPLRITALDNPVVRGAMRLNEHLACHALDAVIRTANKFADYASLDGVLFLGDLVDSGEGNAHEWVRDILQGGSNLRCDSGTPDVVLDEFGNDAFAEFCPEGLSRYLWWGFVAGNHDSLLSGIWTFTEDDLHAAVGTVAPRSTRAWPSGEEITQGVVPDDARVPATSLAEIVEVYGAMPNPPVGYTPEHADGSLRVWTHQPNAQVPLLLVGLETTHYGGDLITGANGYLDRDQRGDLEDALLQAQEDDLAVIVLSHHPVDQVQDEGGDAILADLLLTYPNVVAHLSGHSHHNRIDPYPAPDGASGFWSIETSGIADWPSQSRLLEVVANDDNTLSLYTTMLDFEAEPDSLAEAFRRLTLTEFLTGWGNDANAPGRDATDRNAELIVGVPPGVDFSQSSCAPNVQSETIFRQPAP